MNDKPFEGFSREMFNFLEELHLNPTREWFSNNKKRYDTEFLTPARALVKELAPFLYQISPEIRTAPKINITIKKQFPDARLTRDNPVRDYFVIFFNRFRGDCEFFLYINKNEIHIGIDLDNTVSGNVYFKKNLENSPDMFVRLVNEANISDNYSFYKLVKTPELVSDKLNINKHFDVLKSTGHILIQKVYPRESQFLFSHELVYVIIKHFNELSPLYHFSAAPL